MQYKKDAWIKMFQKTVTDLSTDKVACPPSSGMPAAIAAIRYIRDGLVADVIGTKKPEELTEGDNDTINAIKDGCNELIKAINKDGAQDGFASNASAAAKSAGFKSGNSALKEVSE